MNLTINQQKAVDVRNKNVLVFASAGGGKTRVLVTRLVNRIIEDKISLDEVVAMTFTEAAALNMKSRIQKELNNELIKNPNNKHIKEQLSLLDNAKICTIDSYCLSLIKEYYYLIPIKKDRINNTLDNGKKALLLKEAFNNIVNTHDISCLIGRFSNGLYSLDSIKESLDTIVNKVNSFYDPYVWFDSHHDSRISSFEDLKDSIKSYYLNTVIVSLSNIESNINYILSLEDNAAFRKMKDEVHRLQTYNNNYSKYIEEIVNAFAIKTKCTNEQAKSYRTGALKKSIDKLAKNLIPEDKLVKDYNESIEVSNYLLDLAKDYYKEYQNLKERENVLDFADYEHFAYTLLTKNNNSLGNKLKSIYKEVMIDEFQDTNYTQYELAKLISDNNLFVVGDIKQSIYKFRNAQPSIMRSLMNNPSFEVIHIKENFRSKSNIIDFNNNLYSSLMNLTGDNFLEQDKQEFGLDVQKSNLNKTVFYEVDLELNTYKFIASRIAELVQNEGVSFKDIAVLVRTHNYKNQLVQALKEYNIPHFYSENESYLKSSSLDTIISFFKVLLNGDDLISRVVLLTSSMYKLSDNDILELKNSNYRYKPLENNINECNKYLINNDIFGLISYLLSINDYYLDLPQTDKSNIDTFIKDVESKSFSNLYDLLKYIEDTKEEKANSSSIISNEADVVKVMTIHASKGLEFPIVFVLADTNTLDKSDSNKVLVDIDEGIAIDNFYPKYRSFKTTVKRRALINKNNIENIEEYERLYYVATTRAKERLYIVSEKDGIPVSKSRSLLFTSKGFASYVKAFPNDIEFTYIKEIGDILPFKKEKTSYVDVVKGSYVYNESLVIKPSSHSNNSLFFKDSVDYGTKVHEIFEKLDITKPLDISILNDFPYGKDKVIETLNCFIKNPIIERIVNYEIYKEAEFFEFSKEDSVHGFIDFLAIGDKDAVLIDYKTNSNITRDELIGLYQEQIKQYRDILVKNTQKEVKAYIFSTFLKEFIEM